VSIASAREEIRRRRKLVPIGVDPLAGPWRILSTGGDSSHELRKDEAGDIRCDTCMSRHGRRTCWATARLLDSLGQATPEPAPEPAIGSLSWRDVFRDAGTDPQTTQPNKPPTSKET
jgi:hypothetical protein